LLGKRESETARGIWARIEKRKGVRAGNHQNKSNDEGLKLVLGGSGGRRIKRSRYPLKRGCSRRKKIISWGVKKKKYRKRRQGKGKENRQLDAICRHLTRNEPGIKTPPNQKKKKKTNPTPPQQKKKKRDKGEGKGNLYQNRANNEWWPRLTGKKGVGPKKGKKS